MTGPHRPGDCARCHRPARIEGRSLCRPCYLLERQAQTLERWPLGKPDRQAQVAALLGTGLTHRQIADRLGCSKNSVSLAARRINARKVAADHGEKPLVRPPATTPCAGVDPAVFEVSRHDAAEALAYCARCPVATRTWCVEVAVRPFESRWSGVAGGVIWVRGERTDDRLVEAS